LRSSLTEAMRDVRRKCLKSGQGESFRNVAFFRCGRCNSPSQPATATLSRNKNGGDRRLVSGRLHKPKHDGRRNCEIKVAVLSRAWPPRQGADASARPRGHHASNYRGVDFRIAETTSSASGDDVDVKAMPSPSTGRAKSRVLHRREEPGIAGTP